jgi:hypothetical protein
MQGMIAYMWRALVRFRDIFPDYSTRHGRSGSKKVNKDKKDKSFVIFALFALFVSSGVHQREACLSNVSRHQTYGDPRELTPITINSAPAIFSNEVFFICFSPLSDTNYYATAYIEHSGQTF